jgi:hypothetical protein
VDRVGAGEVAGLGELDGPSERAGEVVAEGDWTLTEATPLEQPAATAASKQLPSRTLLRLPTTDSRSIREVDIPATQA